MIDFEFICENVIEKYENIIIFENFLIANKRELKQIIKDIPANRKNKPKLIQLRDRLKQLYIESLPLIHDKIPDNIDDILDKNIVNIRNYPERFSLDDSDASYIRYLLSINL
jgi:hypothetical protein